MAKTLSPPPVRRLRVYAFDPQVSTQIETAGVNIATIELPWENDVQPGPVNEYLEVIDVDPVSGQFYEPVDLNHPHLLAQDGLAPSEGDPRFHQQMAFAVAMKTIKMFERALGRKVFWSPVWDIKARRYVYAEKLRVYPHALREQNAYYSREKKALLFGYFKASAQSAGASWVFTALSHDIIVHETTHAILDGLHRRFAEPTSVDSLAFHEAFADIVALLAHFTIREAVEAEIAANGGRLDQRSLISGLAKQFGHATGRKGALREAIDNKIDGLPDPNLLNEVKEPHERGAILVAAIFDAFLSIYQRRSADLLRIAGLAAPSGSRPSMHPDLVARLAREAVKAADQVLRMCIRALDYLPPVDVRFGEFLRAIITADTDLVPKDDLGYRVTMIEAFRRRGIVPESCLSLAPDSLLWEAPADDLSLYSLGKHLDLEPRFKRTEAMAVSEKNREAVHEWIIETEGDFEDAKWQRACGVIFRDDLIAKDHRGTVRRRRAKKFFLKDGRLSRKQSEPGRSQPLVEIHSVRTSRRAGPDGQDLRQLIIEVTQRRRGYLDPERQAREDAEQHSESASTAFGASDFIFRGGATLIFDLREGGVLRYAITKRITDDARLEHQRAFLLNPDGGGFGFTYAVRNENEPFALLHRTA